jgi:hypothetical protein
MMRNWVMEVVRPGDRAIEAAREEERRLVDTCLSWLSGYRQLNCPHYWELDL